MPRLSLLVLCFLLGSMNAFAQLPNRSGQIWREYPIIMPQGNSPPLSLQAQMQSALVMTPTSGSPLHLHYAHHLKKTSLPPLMEYLRRETGGETAWINENFGLISCDEQKLYVYHTPAMQQRVAEIIARFQRPETRNVQFVAESRFMTLSNEFAKKSGINDIREPVFQYLHPIVTADGKPVCQSPVISAYWVAKEDIPKLNEGFVTITGVSLSDIHSPKLISLNGQIGGIADILQEDFVTDVIPIRGESGTQYQPVTTTVDQGMKMEVRSLLSYDRRTVTTDIFWAFPYIGNVVDVKFKPSDSDEIKLQQPQVQKLEYSENGHVWPVDGMLIVFIGGMMWQEESRIEAGVPILNKIPFAQRLFSNTAVRRVPTTLSMVLTVRLNDEPPQRLQ